jgi:hypothetical protein
MATYKGYTIVSGNDGQVFVGKKGDSATDPKYSAGCIAMGSDFPEKGLDKDLVLHGRSISVEEMKTWVDSETLDPLFSQFADLDRTAHLRLTAAFEDIELTYYKLWNFSVAKTINEWDAKFSGKCPRTVARFVEENKADSNQFYEETDPCFETDAPDDRDSNKYKQLHSRCLGNIDKVGRVLSQVSRALEITSIHTAKKVLAVKFFTDAKNTATLESVTNDDDGEQAIYAKLVLK